ncbi:ribosome biogenesis GTPase Der [Sphingomonas prati]|uniref:GTPase Der n=1 Tax=Sphingomonas prati TaxID=1843237 RepID=A0A7W9F3J4_9SPHN|nr:ribosome biogenesis GTPase Der [Sphingomonas prati]MBB5729904.1 GTP-binding protein [Sphingomonas prati]GGE88653.1 GTPase Der [Sphingomonas prati]
MAKLPIVAIVGRPNVGKSTLFNRLVGKRVALVDDRPGVTRDRREGTAVLLGMEFKIVDTAGVEDEDPDTLPGRMRMQTQNAVREADVALFLIDARAGIVPQDEEIARWLRSEDTPVILMANKAEGKAAESGVLEAYSLGFDTPMPFSAEHGDGLVDLFEALRPHIEFEGFDDVVDEPEEDEESGPLKLAIVGRPNAGKSTLVNRILGEERMITGPEAGITRDSIAIDWEWTAPDGQVRPVRLIDTAGLRKKAKVQDKLEKLSAQDAMHAVDFAEVVVLLLDATLGLEAQDLRIADQVLQEGRALIIALNKWDVAENPPSLFQGVRFALEEGLAQVRGVPLLTISAETGRGMDQLIQAAFDVREAWSKRVSTGVLNRWFEKAVEINPPPAPGGRRIKLRYLTQAKTRPPGFILFGTRVDQLPESYKRYLMNGIRKDLGFGAVPIRLTVRAPRNPFDR